MSINNWKSMKNVAGSSEKRGCGKNREEHRARENVTNWRGNNERVRHPKTVREKFQVKNTPHSLSHWPAMAS